MKLEFRGTRGSCAAPFPDRSEFGGNTSCASLRSGNSWIVFDAGTGIIPLASEIRQADLAEGAEKCSVKIIISHFHLDHIIGLPMFLAALPKTAEVTMYTACDSKEGSSALHAEQLVSLIGPPLWPVRLTDVCSQLKFADLSFGIDNDIGEGAIIRAIPSNHPNGTSIFRLFWQKLDFVYGLDCETTDAFEATYLDFVHGCDYLLYDGAYTDEDYARCVGFGHGKFSKAPLIAEKAEIKHVYIMHYDYAYTDSQLRAAEETLTKLSDRVCFAREGQAVDIQSV